MKRISPAGRWWVLPFVTAAFGTGAAVVNVIVGNRAVGVVLLALAFITLMGRSTQMSAYRAGYWRGSYEALADVRSLDDVMSGWQPSPWDRLPAPPWEERTSPTEH